MPLELIKTLLAAAAVLLALFQILIMAQVRHWIHWLPYDVRTLLRAHRWGGRATLALATLVGLLCLYVVFGLGYPTGSLQVRSHAILGASAGAVLLAKVLIANRRRALLKHALALGLTAATLLAGAFAASGLVYLVTLAR